MHPLLHLLMTRPELLSEHAQAYAELASSEVSHLVTAGRHRMLWGAAALCCATAAVVLAGVALMLAVVLPESRAAALWALLLAPGLPLAGALACVLTARAHPCSPAFSELREQVRIDLQLLKEVTSP
jgi:hypothetical protein